MSIHKLKYLAFLLVSIFAGLCLNLYIEFLENSISLTGITNLIYQILHPQNISLLLIIIIVSFLLLITIFNRKILNTVINYRFIIGILLLIVCVFLKINGSSIGALSLVLPNGKDEGILLGISRTIRSDEYAVFTPMAISQYANDFSYTGELFRGTVTDMYAVYGQAVFYPLILLRPFQLGYLFLPLENALSFYWCSRLICLFLVSYQFNYSLTEKKKLSLIYAFLLSFSPFVQWWFSINCLVEILIFGQSIILVINKYFNSIQKRKWIWCLLLAYFSGCYILTAYPAWEVPFFYVFLMLGIWEILQAQRNHKLNIKDLIYLSIYLVLIALIGLTFYYKSSEVISAVMNTSYPGERLETGGGGLSILFTWIGNLFLPIKEANMPLNASENSSIFCFAPLGLILTLRYVFCSFKEQHEQAKNSRQLIYLLLGVYLVLFVYLVFGFPEWLAKITLLGKTTVYRIVPIITFIDLLFLMIGLSHINEGRQISLFLKVLLSITLCLLNLYEAKIYYGDYYNQYMYLVEGAVLILAYFGFLLYNQKQVRDGVLYSIIILSFLLGGLVNPIRVGLSTVLNNTLYNQVQEISETDSDAVWITEDFDFRVSNTLAAAGAKTLNSTNVYPNIDLWSKVDYEDQEEIYNRYAHIVVELQNETPTAFELLTADSFKIYLNSEDLEKLNIRYIYSPNDLSQFNSNNQEFKVIETNQTGSIYQVIYK